MNLYAAQVRFINSQIFPVALAAGTVSRVVVCLPGFFQDLYYLTCKLKRLDSCELLPVNLTKFYLNEQR